MFFITKKLISLAFFGFVLFCVLYTVGFWGDESPFRKNITDIFHSFHAPTLENYGATNTSHSSNMGSWQERRKIAQQKEDGITHIEKEEEEKDFLSNFYLDSNPKSDPDQFSFKNFYK